jgi:serine/threonine protein kinase
MADAPEKDLAKDGLLAIAPRDSSGRPTLGGIPLYRKLGQGGMGAVYLGKHPRLGVDVAVKILPFHLADQDPNSIEYFMREANVAARLNHPSLVRIFDVNVDGDPKAGSAIWYLVMEFVSGRTAGRALKDRMKAGQGPLPETDALDILLTVSDGLAAAHEQRFIHRDIKPDNIIIPAGPDGELLFRKAKLMDLGLAKTHSEELSLGPTGTNVAMGTPGYMAPEQAENAKAAGPPADVFAMGATLYSLLCGSAPFTGTTVLNVLKKTSEEAHVPLAALNPAVSRATGVLVDTCLAKRPEARYASAGILREALKACRQALDGDVPADVTLASLQNLATFTEAGATLRTAEPSSPAPSARTSVTVPGAPARSKKKVMVAAVVAVLAIGAGALLLPRGKSPGPPPPPAASTLDPEFDAWMRDAEAAMENEEYARAENLFAKAKQKNPSSEKAADGEARARRLKEDETAVSSAMREFEALTGAKNHEEAWKRIRAAIRTHPESVVLRIAAARLALAHGPYAWMESAITHATNAERMAGRRLKPAAAQVLKDLEEKKRKAALAGGVLPEIQAAIDKGEWDAAEKLLEKAEPADREEFKRAIAQGRQWRAAFDRGRRAEDARRLTEALAAYQEALAFRVEPGTDEAVRRVDREIKSLYDTECDTASDRIKAGKFDDARKHLAAAEQLQPAAPRHAKLREEVQFQELLAEARGHRTAGRNAEALAAATKALAIRSDSAEARALAGELQKEGPLAMAKAALAAGDPASAAKHARAAAAHGAPAADLKALELELWANLFVERAVAPSKGPVDELTAASDGRIVGVGSGYSSYAVWAPGDLKPEVVAAPGGGRPFHPALIEKDGIRVAGLTGLPGPDGFELQPVAVWDQGVLAPLQMETSGVKLKVTGTRLASYDGPSVIRVRWTAGGLLRPDSYALDVLDTASVSASNAISNGAQAHASIAVARRGRYFATGGGIYRTWKREGGKVVVDERKADTQVYLWSRSFPPEKRPVDLGEPVGEGALLAFTPDGSRLLVATASRKLFVIDAESGRPGKPILLPEAPEGLAVGPTRAAALIGRGVVLVDLDGARAAPVAGLPPARSAVFSADGASLFLGGEDGLLRRYAYEPLTK